LKIGECLPLKWEEISCAMFLFEHQLNSSGKGGKSVFDNFWNFSGWWRPLYFDVETFVVVSIIRDRIITEAPY
jgi:hypothetical protein